MKNIKAIIAMSALVVVLGVAGVAYAADYKTPADIAAAVTGKSINDVNAERAEGKSYGTIANEAEKLDEFKAQLLEQRKAVLDQRVKDGQITQEQADEMYNNIKDKQSTCTGEGSGQGAGCGMGQGKGQGMGKGMGRGAGNGSCTVTGS